VSVASTAQEAKQTVEFDDVTWKRAVNLMSAVAHLRMTDKDMQGYIARATDLALSREKVKYEGDGVYAVAGSDGTHQVVAKSCDCENFVHGKAPSGLCKHRLAVMMVMRAAQLTPAQLTLTPEELKKELEQQARLPVVYVQPEEGSDAVAVDEEEPPVVAALPGTETENTIPYGIDPRFIERIQNKDFVKYEGLLVLAHERGLQSLTAAWTYNDPELSLAHATAVFPFGTFAESGDASPNNVTKKVAPHFRRVALTRAKARCLRDALNIGLVAVEEME